MARTIFVTGGTSALYDRTDWVTMSGLNEKTDLFLKLEQQGVGSDLYQELFQNATLTLKNNLQSYLNTRRQRELRGLSAEMASMLKFQESYGNLSERDTIYILHSDTVDGEFCAQANSKVMESKINNLKGAWTVKIHKIDKLKIENIAIFQEGLENLKELIMNLVPNEGEKFMNITAGYKGLLPYATVLGWDYGMDIIYLFEESFELLKIKIPRGWTPVFDKLF